MAGLSHSLPDTHKTPLATRSRFGFCNTPRLNPHIHQIEQSHASHSKAAPQSDPDTIGFLMVYVLKDLKRMAFWSIAIEWYLTFCGCELTSYLQIVILLSEPTGLQDSKSRQLFLSLKTSRLVLLYLDSVIIYLSVMSTLLQKFDCSKIKILTQ